MTQRVVIVGAGGHGRDTLDVFRACNRATPGAWEVVAFVSEVVADHSQQIGGIDVVGSFEWFEKPRDVKVVCALGDPAVRQRLVQRAIELGLEFATVVHPAAVVPPEAVLGTGVIISAGVMATSSMVLGDHVLLNLGSTVAHDTVLGDFCTLAPGVHVSGRVRIGEGTELGTGAVVLPRVQIGAWSMVGAGAVVTANLPDHVTAVGVPARVIKSHG